MGYEKHLARSFRQAEPHKLTYALLLICFIVLLTYLSVSKPYDALLSNIGLKLSGSDSAQYELMSSVERRNSSSADFRVDTPHPKEGDEVKVIHDFVESTKNLSNQTVVAVISREPKEKKEESSGKELAVESTKKLSNHTAVAVISTELNQKKEERSGNELDASKAEEEQAINPQQWKSMCDYSNRRSNICELAGDVRIATTNPSVILVAKSQSNFTHKIRPYARKSDPSAMSNVAQLTLTLAPFRDSPLCTHRHRSPALIFSLGGYSGNYFHAFTDVFLPLYQSARFFNKKVHFFVTDFHSLWVKKYLTVFQSLSDYEILRFGEAGDDSVHCFPKAVVGLQCYNDMLLKNGESMVHFTEFLRRAYSLERNEIVKKKKKKKKMRLLIIARSHTRKFVNLEEIVRMVEEVGFEAVVAEAGGNVGRFARVVNTCDVMMGVHGAGLTNIVFLPVNAVVIQVVPWGKLDWISKTYFKEPAISMKLRYLEYDIEEDESTLMEVYGRDDPVMREPESVHRLGWERMKEIYLEKQNVRLNVTRFRGVLVEAMKILRKM